VKLIKKVRIFEVVTRTFILLNNVDIKECLELIGEIRF